MLSKKRKSGEDFLDFLTDGGKQLSHMKVTESLGRKPRNYTKATRWLTTHVQKVYTKEKKKKSDGSPSYSPPHRKKADSRRGNEKTKKKKKKLNPHHLEPKRDDLLSASHEKLK